MSRTTDRISVIGLDFRIMHIFLILGLGLLLFTALGIGDDGRSLSQGLNFFLLHQYIGIAWGILIVFYAFYSLFRRRRVRILEPLSRPIGEQVREGFSVVGKYFLNIPVSNTVKSGMGRHNVMASYAFVMLLTGIVLLGAGGIGMILVNRGNFEDSFFLGVHLAGVGLIALFVLAHLFAILNRSNWPLIPAVFLHGKVRREWAEESMPAYTEDSDGKR